MRETLKIIVFVGAAFLWPLSADAVQVQLEPVMDAALYEDDSGALANGSGDYLFFGKVGSSPVGAEKLRRSLIKFDVSSIPPGAVIDQVSLSVQINQVPMVGAIGGLASLHRVTSPWDEGASDADGAEGQGIVPETGDSTWLHRTYPGNLWSTPGGDFQFAPSAQAGYGVIHEALLFTSSEALQHDVKAWISNPSNNHGWILRGNEAVAYSARRIYARESTGLAVPLLTVDYSIPSPTDNLALTQIATGLNSPVAIANANDGSGRLFIVERGGRIRIFDTVTQTLIATPYLDISSLVDSASPEQGLLGLAFHPDFASNRKFYVYYVSDPDGLPDPSAQKDLTVIAMYQQSIANSNLADSVINPVILMEFIQDAANHNGGDMHFGADGYLNIATGDGGGTGDTFNNAQNVNSLKGKILRIDVDGAPAGGDELCGLVTNYGIPAGNAFPGGSNGCDEILHLGLRNPWKFSFDAQTEEMYIGDVGQFAWEEVDYAAKDASGLNFGWPCREGLHSYPPPGGVTCPNAVDPIIEYPSSGTGISECSVTGGYVYRGSGANMAGYYVYGDFCSDKIWLAKNANGNWSSIEWEAAAPVLDSLSAFGQDEQCELYVADLTAGKLFRIDDDEMVQRSGFEALRCQ